MAAPAIRIGRLATRVHAPDPEAGFAAGRLVDAALRRIGPALDARLPGALAAAGLAEGAVVAIPHLALRLRLEGDVGAEELSAAWAEALAQAILAALPAVRRGGGPPAHADEALRPALHRDHWQAELALLLAASRGEAMPWWAAGTDLAADGAAARLLLAWIERDPGRAAAIMARLLEAAPEITAMPTAEEASRLTSALLRALQGALPAAAPIPSPPGLAAPAALAPLLSQLPEVLRGSLAALPPTLRGPWVIAAVMARAPGWAPLLPALLPALVALESAIWHSGSTQGHAAPPPSAMPRSVPAGTALPPETPIQPAMESSEVSGGGLLLLLRPLALLEPGWLALGGVLSDRLLGLGLLAMQRLTAPLSPAARRALLERDRPLLAVFSGMPPPDAALDTLAVTDPAIEVMLARLLAAMPEGISAAPGALRRTYGRDPFTEDPATAALCRLVLRPGRLRWDAAMAEMVWPLDAADIALRRAGWDIDPGWLPWIGRRIGFRYGGGG